MERGARVLQTSKDVDKYVLIVEVSNNNSKMTVWNYWIFFAELVV